MKKFAVVAAMATALLGSTSAMAADLEVTHWWTSAGEAAAIAEFAKIFEAETGNTWVDSALAGSGTGANPVIISRIIGGDPMGATQMNTGRDAEELIQAGLIRDLTPIVEEMGGLDFYADQSLLEPCTYDGKIYCFPINIHSWDWLWLSTAAYEKAGIPVPKDWNEYVASWPKLEEAGILPFGLATGWPISGVPGKDYECLPALGLGDKLSGGGDSFYFPVLPEGTDQAVIDAQTQLAKILISPEGQLKFNLVKGSMPIRTDIDLSAANPCMQKALGLLKNGLLPSGDFALSSDTQQQLQDLNIEFLDDDSITVDDYVERYASIIESAD